MSCHPSRREFIAGALAAGGGLADAGRLWAEPVSGHTRPPDVPRDMAIVRYRGRAPPRGSLTRRLTEMALDGLGGMGRFVRRGDVVWIKPNIGRNRRPEQAANTHPEVVAALAALCFRAGAYDLRRPRVHQPDPVPARRIGRHTETP